MFTLLVSLLTFSALFAQYDRGNDNHGYNNGNGAYNNRGYNNNGGYNNPNAGVEMPRNDGPFQHDNRFDNGYGRHEEADRDHHDYDRRMDGYHDDRWRNDWDGDWRRDHFRRERYNHFRNIGGAVLVAGALGVIIASHR